jgi:hypothetical protein
MSVSKIVEAPVSAVSVLEVAWRRSLSFGGTSFELLKINPSCTFSKSLACFFFGASLESPIYGGYGDAYHLFIVDLLRMEALFCFVIALKK